MDARIQAARQDKGAPNASLPGVWGEEGGGWRQGGRWQLWIAGAVGMGLRTLRRTLLPDPSALLFAGESFYFRINGVPVYVQVCQGGEGI